jgi:phosphopantothenoylcysteine decarboxylase/phosphopantothenate--cysteine ligase
MPRLLIGVSGGIAAYKALELARLAIKSGHAVRVIQTPASERFVGRASFEAITGAPVLTSEFEPDPARGAYPGDPAPEHAPISHLALVDRADLYLIVPASANTLAKLAHGLADNLVTTAALAAGCPIVVAPAMNDRMYLHPATQDNLDRLRARGVTVIPPTVGELASRGERGVGRLVEPAELVSAAEALLAGVGVPDGADARWSGVRVLVTAGGTREPIDSVRFIGNRSSGRMGVALAARAAARGAEVTIVAANLAVPAPPGAHTFEVETAAQLAAATAGEFERCDVLLMAAAVADFRPAEAAGAKIKKSTGPPELRLVPTVDILATLGERRAAQVLVGFAAETAGVDAVMQAEGRRKLAAKGVDLMVVNEVGRVGTGFGADTDRAAILAAGGEDTPLRDWTKAELAAAICDRIAALTHGGR